MRDSIPEAKRKKEKVNCYPLYSLLLAVNQAKNVDFLSLDLEGAELAVLKTIPWEKVNIKLIMVEMNHSDKYLIFKLLTEAGYSLIELINDQDAIFVKN